jgi:hypothetical protein
LKSSQAGLVFLCKAKLQGKLNFVFVLGHLKVKR